MLSLIQIDLMEMTSQDKNYLLRWRQVHITATYTNKCRWLICTLGDPMRSTSCLGKICAECMQCASLFASKLRQHDVSA